MATKDDVVRGIELLVQEVTRLRTALTEDQWQNVVDLDGWKSREVLAHIAGVATLIQPMAGGMTSAPAGADTLGAIDIDQMNAGLVAARAGKTTAELIDEAVTAYTAAIAFIRNADAATLDHRVNALGYKDVPLSDIIVRMVVLHGLAHVYSVYTSVFYAK